MRGTIRGDSILLDDHPDLADGQRVEITMRPVAEMAHLEDSVVTIAPFVITGSGDPINSLESWFDLAPPKGGELHWRDGRSAKELARYWLATDGSPRLPIEIAIRVR